MPVSIPDIVIRMLKNRAQMFRKNGNCLEWQGGTSDKGYGYIIYDKFHYPIHRVTWVSCYGDIPDNLVVAHRCNNKLCANPSHLYLTTLGQNVKDAFRDDIMGRKLNTRKVVLIKALINSKSPKATWNYFYKVVSSTFGVSASLIRAIREGKRHANVSSGY